MNSFTAEQIAMARECKTVEALITFAKENNIELTEAEAEKLFDKLDTKNKELTDTELQGVAGGARGGVSGPIAHKPDIENMKRK